MRIALLKLCVLCLLLLLTSIPTHAQPLFPHADSIETTVTNAALVVFATLEKYDDAIQRLPKEREHES